VVGITAMILVRESSPVKAAQRTERLALAASAAP
jgi:hypothetical protein